MTPSNPEKPARHSWFAWVLLLLGLGLTAAGYWKVSRFQSDTEPFAVLLIGILVSVVLFALAQRHAKTRAAANVLRSEIKTAEQSLQKAQTELALALDQQKAADQRLKELQHELIRLREERARTSKLESVGWVAGSIAHDFNNVLTGIMGSVSLLREERGLSPAVTEKLQALELAGLRAHELTRKLLALNQGGAPLKQPIDLPDLVRPVVEEALRGTSLHAEFAFAENLPRVSIDPGQITQALHHILNNAREAMPNGGGLRISTRLERPASGNEQNLPERPLVALDIQDHGHGISSQLLPRIFDPSFTTKQAANGLGLPTARAILRRHEGFITAKSEPGKGTTFTLLFPLLAEKPVEPQAEDAPLTGKGRVLAMDDEAAIRGLLAVLLEHVGYEVTTVADGTEALREYGKALQEKRPYGAVILDLFVPRGMGGKEALRQLRALDPNVKTIISSGDSNDPAVLDYEAHGFTGRVEKPYRLRELAAVLNSAMHDGEHHS